MTFGRSEPISAEAIPQPLRGRDRRLTLRALKSWNESREDGKNPDLTRLTVQANMMDERDVFTENHFLIMVDAHTSNTVVIFYGDNLPNMLHQNNLGNSLQQTLPASLKGIFQDACLEAVKTSDVVYRHGMITAASGDSVLYRSIFMPLWSDSQTDRIYVFGAFSNEEGATELLAA